ncbi:hypothetical protein SBF1_110035 [Candidatus Desulfosporosinus infrequens]|uniref:Uncharacterized protein n=1 Tax=Candidatus Desulfosporosinus infrequens TaxID=2043169 RepID=A0A2U3JX31_9FIRM|nr:hypothetical protein SBF1_110035 [Candidatus Desulfosporosinus infrequens]
MKKIADIQILEKLEVIENLMKSYKSFQVVRMAIDSGLFDWLEKTGRRTRKEIFLGVKLLSRADVPSAYGVSKLHLRQKEGLSPAQ